MEVPVEATSRHGTERRSLPAYRIGDVALFLVWALFGAAAAFGAAKQARADDLPAAAYRAMVAVAFFVNAILFLLRGPAVKRGAGFRPKLVALIGTWTITPLAALPLTWHPDWLLVGSTAVLVGVYAIVVWAMLTLRRSFSVFPEARQLVRHGPYALVRHPLYAAYFLTYVLIAVPRVSPVAVALAAVGIAAEAWRARHEECVLSVTIPDYAAYAATTPRFVPRMPRRRTIGRYASERAG